MKKVKFTAAILGFILLGSCMQNSGDQRNYTAHSECYMSYSGSDSASLNLRYQYGRIEGNLSLYFADKDNLTGKIQGNFVGDTLFAAYTYRLGQGSDYYKNEVAFLKKDGKLYQGYGEVTSTYGMTLLNRKLPIDFNKGFIFDPADCE